MAYSLRLGLKDAWHLLQFHRKVTKAYARGTVEVFQSIRVDLEHCLGSSLAGLRVLEIGSGQRYHNIALLAATGAQGVGIDLEPVGPGLRKYKVMLRTQGLGRLIKSLGRSLLFDRSYFNEMSRAFGGPLPRKNLDLRVMDATQLAFADESFDAVISTAVFEHLPDVSAVVAQIARVLRPGGICRVAVHLYPSISGGHHLAWNSPEGGLASGVPAWDHLRENRFPSHSYLNGWRKQRYLDAFQSRLEVIETRISSSGEVFLTPELEAELAAKGYARAELLETELLILARKRQT